MLCKWVRGDRQTSEALGAPTEKKKKKTSYGGRRDPDPGLLSQDGADLLEVTQQDAPHARSTQTDPSTLLLPCSSLQVLDPSSTGRARLPGTAVRTHWKRGCRQAEAIENAAHTGGRDGQARRMASRPRLSQGAQQPALGPTMQMQTLSQKPVLPLVAPAPGGAPARRRLSLTTHSILA